MLFLYYIRRNYSFSKRGGKYNLDSIRIIRDNIKVQQNIKRLYTYKSLSNFTQIPESTIKNWFCPQKINNERPVYPRLTTLDKLCDALEIHTSDLFIASSKFKHTYTSKNNSLEAFRTNFNRICINKGFSSINSRINYLFFDEDEDVRKELYYSLLRSDPKRIIPIARLDIIATRLEVESYELLL